jgi:hypothetical protein
MWGVDRTRVRRRRLVLALAWVLLAGWWGGPLAHALGSFQPDSGSERRVVVGPGDTLWSIARRVAPGEDPRAVVDSIAAENHVEPGALVPGQTLVVREQA